MTLRDVYEAKKRIEGWALRTPLAYSYHLSDLCGGDVWLKLENLQPVGSFKIRGAMNKLLLLTEEEKARGVVTASSGNHAQGVGYAARELGVQATIVVPGNTPDVKLGAIRRYGVDLIVHGEEYMDAERLAQELEKEKGMTFVSGYNDPDIIAGQGTVGLEMLEDRPDLDLLLVPVGGGGLISGVTTVFKAATDAEVLGVQSVASPVMAESVRQGRIVDMELGDSVAEGLHGGIEEGSITFDFCRRLVDDFILVQEATILDAMRLILTEERQVVEGSAAVGVAAMMEDPDRFRGRKVGVVITGGNVDKALLREVCKI